MNASATSLTIAIPTYKRNNLLNKALLNLLDARVRDFSAEVLVFDNQSPDPVYASIPADVRDAFGPSLKVVTNPHNVGPSANIVRCMENAEGEWLWILSDDDPPVDTALERIFSRISEVTAETVLINFAPPGIKRAGARLTTGLPDFLKMANPLWPYTNISCSVHRRSSIGRLLEPTFRAIYSLYPYISHVLIETDRGASVLHVPDPIIDFTKDAEFSWSRLELELGKTTLAELPIKWKSKVLFYKHLRKTTPGPRAFARLLENQCPQIAERCVLMNQFMQRRFADRPLEASALSWLMMAYVIIRSAVAK